MSQTVVPSRAARHAAPSRPQRPAPQRGRALKPGPARPRGRRFRWSWWYAVPALAVALGVVGGIAYAYSLPLPDPNPNRQIVQVQDASGKLIGTFAPQEGNRQVIPLNQIPMDVRHAVMAAEDRDFYEHGPVSYRGLGRALMNNLRGKSTQGGSTITQQYVKNAYDDNERSYTRKLREAVAAFKVEDEHAGRVGKDFILEGYLNTIYFGRGAYGIQAAAKAYFGVNAKDLKTPQAAFLAGAIKNPEFFANNKNLGRVKTASTDRRNFVLRVMGERGWLDQAAVAKAKAAPLGVQAKKPLNFGVANSRYPYFMEEVRRAVQELPQVGPDGFQRGGLVVRTTLNVDYQKAAEAAVNGVLDDPEHDPLAAFVALNPQNGEVLAMYGGRDFNDSQVNLATNSSRQVGSTMKPFVLAEWLRQGKSIDSNLDNSVCAKGANREGSSLTKCFDPDRPLRRKHLVGIRTAVKHSYNIPFLDMINQTGIDEVANLAKQAGMDYRITKADSQAAFPEGEIGLALGANEANTLQLTSAFGVFANRGEWVRPRVLDEVRTLDGKGVIWRAPNDKRRVLDQNKADIVNDILQNVLRPGGTGEGARLDDREAAGKTGTTNDYKDARFVGYTPNLVASAWLGYDDNSPMHDLHGADDVTGGSLPARIWRNFMQEISGQLEQVDFTPPDNLNEGEIVNPTTTTTTTTTLPPETTAPPQTAPPQTQPPATEPPATQPPATQPPPTQSTFTPPSSTFDQGNNRRPGPGPGDPGGGGGGGGDNQDPPQ